MAIKIIPVGTRIPRLEANKINKDSPVYAFNCTNDYGDLTPLYNLTSGTSIDLYVPGDYIISATKVSASWVYFFGDTDIVHSELPNSNYRFYFCAPPPLSPLSPFLDCPQVSDYTMVAASDPEDEYPNSRPMGVLKPSSAPTITIYGTANPAYDDVYVSYYYTYVTNWGEESAPCPATAVTTVVGGKYTSVKNIVDPDKDYITHVRFYRAESTSDGSSVFSAIAVRPGGISATPLWDVPLSTITSTSYQLYDANSSTSPTGLSEAGSDVCPSESWDMPPDDMIGLKAFINGMLIGFDNKTLCISEPLVPYAWPVEYQHNMNYSIVGLGVYDSNIIVLTESNPYIVQGISPTGMVKIKLSSIFGCVSKMSIADTPDGVIYATSEGLFRISNSEPEWLTEKLITPEQWRGWNPEKLKGVYYKGWYYGFFMHTYFGFRFNPRTGEFSEFAFKEFRGVYLDSLSGDLFVICPDYIELDFKIHKWEGSSSFKSYMWQTADIEDKYGFIEAIQIISPYDNGDITVQIFYDWTLDYSSYSTEYPSEVPDYYPDYYPPDVSGVTSLVFSDCNFKWLPVGNNHRFISFRITGSSKISEINLATSPEELV